MSILRVMHCRLGRALIALAGCLVLVACGEPPTKEMDLARTAIAAAERVHADRYAAADLKAAQDAFEKSTAAVAAHDFKLALNHALASHDRAQTAAQAATVAEQAQRAQLQQRIEDATARSRAARADVAAAARTRGLRRAASAASVALDTIAHDLQEARAQVEGGDLETADRLSHGAAERVAAAIATLQPGKRPATANRQPAHRAR